MRLELVVHAFSTLVMGGFALWLGACTPAAANKLPAGVNGQTPALLPAGLRRLTNAEFVRGAEALLQAPLPVEFVASLPPDVRQEDGYTRNREQTMSPALAVKLAEELPRIVNDVLEKDPNGVFECQAKSGPCVQTFVRKVVERAYRRPSEPSDEQALGKLFASASASGTARDGAVTVLSTVLQSPRFWYVTEQGIELPSNDRVVRLEPYEVADQLAFVVSGEGADAELLADLEALYDPKVRGAHAQRLLSKANTRRHYREFVLQWLEVDDLLRTAKSSSVFEPYEEFKQRMLEETQNFADEVFVHEGASLESLLTAGFVSVDPHMAVFYGLRRFGARVPASAQGRIGVLQHASFLAAHAHADTTSPVLRGDFVLRKVLCDRVPRPSELDIEIIMPRPSEERTRREQFALHGADPKCAQCHDKIDGFGLTLEHFDAAGRARQLELGKPVRTDGAVTYRGERVAFDSSVELSRWLAQQPQAHDCFARHAFRFVTGQSDEHAENAFVALRHTLPASQRNNLLAHLVAYVATEAFIYRRTP